VSFGEPGRSSASWRQRLGDAYGIRIVVGWGVERTLRILSLVVWAGLLANVILVARPDLLHTADFGSDTSNYAAFGERLAEQGDLYALRPGDRPVPADNPPVWTVPILSPPQMAVPWAAIAWMPDAIRFYVPWACGVCATIAAGVLFLRRAPVVLLLVTLPFLKGLAITAWSGNVNAFVAPAALLAWWAGEAQIRRTGVLAGGAVAAALGAVKIGPTLLWAWIVGRRPLEALSGGLLAIGVLTGVVLLLVGLTPFQDYLGIAAGNTSDPSAWSLLGILTDLGLSPTIARTLWAIVAIGLGITALLSRRRPALAMAAAAAGLVVLTPIVRNETVSVALIVAGTPWIVKGGPSDIKPTILIASLVAAAAVGISILTGGLDRSSFRFENATDDPVVVRFSVSGWSASWGYLVGPGEAGAGWADEVGTVEGSFSVFDPACQVLAVTDLPSSGGSYKILGGAVVQATEIAVAAYLPYDTRCSGAAYYGTEAP
jgi:hypothetical protein